MTTVSTRRSYLLCMLTISRLPVLGLPMIFLGCWCAWSLQGNNLSSWHSELLGKLGSTMRKIDSSLHHS